MNQTIDSEIAPSAWKSLYKVGGVAALIGAAIVPIQMVVFIAWPPPALDAPVSEWFALLQDNPLRGLLNLDLLYLVSWVLLIPVLLALYVALRQVGEAVMVIAAATGFVAIVVFCTSIVGVEMLFLSNRYTAATTEAEQLIYLAAGQAMLATYQGTPFHVSLILGALALVAISAVMLRNTTFSRVTAWAGITGNALSLGFYIPGIGVWLLTASVLPLFVWLLLLGRTLLKLGRRVSRELSPSEDGGALLLGRSTTAR
jgi:hypothetical protein